MVSLWLLVLAVVSVEAGPRANASNWTPLDEYVYREDDFFDYEPLFFRPGLVSNVHVLNMTSQRWKNDSVTSQSVWWHPVSIFIPHELAFTDAALLFIHVGDNTDEFPDEDNDDFYTLAALFAELSGATVVYLKNVPNQPMTFPDDPRGWSRREDSIIAYTWKKFIIDGMTTDPEMILFFPMAKAVVMAMDAATEYALRVDPRTLITRYILAGGSKRGWTAILATALDDRVVGMIPMVFSLYNMRTVLKNQHRALDGWTFAFRDYFWENLTREIDNPNTVALANLIDPMSFNDRFVNVPKYIISAAKDEFFMPDDTKHFWNELKGPKIFWMAENAPHWLEGKYPEVAANSAAFFRTVMNNNPIPGVSWNFTINAGARTGTITFTTDTAPRAVNLWVADPTIAGEVGNRRDFRWQHLVPGYVPPPGTDVLDFVTRNNTYNWVQDNANLNIIGNDAGILTYQATENFPDTNENEVHTAFYIEARYATPDLDEIEITSEVLIIPDTYPRVLCAGADCAGALV